MVGREFVPNEDMGEWTIHIDAPEGTSLEGTSGGRVQAAEGAEAASKASRRSSRRSASPASRRRRRTSTSCVRRCRIDERKNTQAQIITEMRRRLAAHPSYRPSITSRNALGSGEGTGGFAISANILGPDLDQIADYSKQALPRRRSCRASPTSRSR